MLDIICEDFITDMPEAHISRNFATRIASEKMWKNMVTSKSFIAFIAKSVRRKTDTTL